jgi:hypothetical protein
MNWPVLIQVYMMLYYTLNTDSCEMRPYNTVVLYPLSINRPLVNSIITRMLHSTIIPVIHSTNVDYTKTDSTTIRRLQYIYCINISLYKRLIGSRSIRWCVWYILPGHTLIS